MTVRQAIPKKYFESGQVAAARVAKRPPGKRPQPGQIGAAAMCVRAMICVMSLCAAGAHAAIPATERQALLDLYSSTNGATWTTSTGWNGAAGSECTWFRVTCNPGATAVLEINLSGNNLTGALPASIATLTQMETFVADGSGLTGSIPALSGMTALRTFNVARNKLDGSIGSLTGLSALQNFDVSNNRLTGGIPALTGLSALRFFTASTNRLSGALPSLDGLNQLTSFDASFNDLGGTIPAFNAAPALASYRVLFNQLSGTIPSLANLGALQSIEVQDNQLTGAPPAIAAPSALRAGGSTLCPNLLTPAANAAWDAATGDTPWSRDCEAFNTVTITGGANGEVFQTGAFAVGVGGALGFRATPDAGYGVIVRTTCTPDGNDAVLPTDSPPFYVVLPSRDCTASANFSNAQFTVTVNVGPNGSASASGAQSVLYGTQFAFTATADASFTTRIQTQCGGVAGYFANGNTFHTYPVNANCTVNITFQGEVPSFTVTPSAGPNGSISPGSEQSIMQGTRADFVVTPAPGYQIGSVTGCGGTLEGNHYTTAVITANCTVVANFVLAAVPAVVPTMNAAWLALLATLLAAVATLRLSRDGTRRF
jgi:Divergent InlB B-repeat domain